MASVPLAIALIASMTITVDAAPVGAVVLIAPTITDDLVDPDDGELSLREAISFAAAQSSDTQINLPSGRYELTRCGAPEDFNFNGDLDFDSTFSLDIRGAAEIVNTCANDGVLDLRTNGSVYLEDLDISGGDRTDPDKGALHIAADGSTGAGIGLESVTVHDNVSHLHNGAVTLTSASGAVNIEDSTITTNDGGGLNIAFPLAQLSTPAAPGNDVYISGSQISDNTSAQLNPAPASTNFPLSAGLFAGMSVLYADELVIESTTIIDNELSILPEDLALGISAGNTVGGIAAPLTTDVRLFDVVVSSNSGGTGGVSHFPYFSSSGSDSSFTATDVDISGNTSLSESSATSGGAFVAADDVTLTTTEITGNTSPPLTATGGNAPGGLMVFSSREATLNDTTVSGNSGGLGGAFIFGSAYDPITDLGGSDLLVTDSSVSNNMGLGDGSLGGIALVGTRIAVESTVIEHNSGGIAGGTIVHAAETLHVIRTTAADNAATTGTGGLELHGHDELIIEDSTIARNTGATAGGATVSSFDGRVTLRRSTLHRNTATDSSGVGAVNAQRGDIRVASTTITNNNGAAAGGLAVATDASYFGIYYSTLTWNTGNLVVDGPAQTESWMTVISTPKPGNVACSGVVHFRGAGNYDTDGSCNWTGTNDTSNGPNPLLAPLRDNGGHVWTRRPDDSSPLRNVLVAQSTICASAGLAANGVQRPVGGMCDIGAMERG